MYNFGIVRDNAETIDVQTKGSTTVLTVQAVGVTKRACKRGARKEASDLIPIPRQTVVNSTKLRSSTSNKKWMFTISDE